MIVRVNIRKIYNIIQFLINIPLVEGLTGLKVLRNCTLGNKYTKKVTPESCIIYAVAESYRTIIVDFVYFEYIHLM